MARQPVGNRKKEAFWAWILGLAILGLVAWGVYEIFDEDSENIDLGTGEVGWVQDNLPPDELTTEEVPLAPGDENIEPSPEQARNLVP